jgi:hypothetical protein
VRRLPFVQVEVIADQGLSFCRRQMEGVDCVRTHVQHFQEQAGSADHFHGVAHHDRVVRDRSADHRAGTDDAMRSDGAPCQDDAILGDVAVISDGNTSQVLGVGPAASPQQTGRAVVSEKNRASGDRDAVAEFNQVRIRRELIRENHAIVANLYALRS